MKKTSRRFGGKFNILKKNNDIVKTYDEENDAWTSWISTFPQEEEIYITKVVYKEPATIVFWSDNTKTVAKCHGADIYTPETGLMICCLKKIIGSSAVKLLINDWASIFYKVNENDKIDDVVTIKDVRARIKQE